MSLRCLIVDDNSDFREEMRLISTHEESEYADLIEESPAPGFLATTELSAVTIRGMLATGERSETGGTRQPNERGGT